MAFNSWLVAWATDRETVVIPSGGTTAIARVARRYGVHWLLADPASWQRPQTVGIVSRMRGDVAGLHVATVYADKSCRVYRLDFPDDRLNSAAPARNAGQPAE